MGISEYQDFLGRDLAQVDPDIQRLISLEEERQARRLIFVPSESMCPLPVRQALGSVFTNIYAEGYPSARMMAGDEGLLLDFAHQLADYRRYSDRRFYKGAEYVNLVECLAQRRCADCFATPEVSASDILVNVQPLSGAAANLAVYEAFLEVGDTLMGMDLFQGGHLTHGSPFNISGRRYKVVSYGVEPDTERLDYDAIHELAMANRPKLIVAGFTSYPWAPDWARFRQIADACGAILMADIAHTAGLISAGSIASPVGFADVITFTTHKTMCGPRGAVIMTTDDGRAKKINSAIFPGEQGGPHTNKFAAMAVAFKIARTPQFGRLQQSIVQNAAVLAERLASRGLRLAYGGTDTHMLLVDLKSIETPTGLPLLGEPAVRILDLCGLVANKNTIPGDNETSMATGIRLGTPWLSQRGMGPGEMDRIADILHRVLTSIHPFTYSYLRRETPRGKIDLGIMEQAKREVEALTAEAVSDSAWYDAARQSATHHGAMASGIASESGAASASPASPTQRSGYPHFVISEADNPLPSHDAPSPEVEDAAATGAVCLDLSHIALFLLRGRRANLFLEDVCTTRMNILPGQATRTLLLGSDGELIADVALWRLGADDLHRRRYLLAAHPGVKERVAAWLRGLSDGHILFDHDVLRKIPGPVVIEELAQSADNKLRDRVLLALHGPKSAQVLAALGAVVPDEGSVWSGRVGETPLSVARLDMGAMRFEILVREGDKASFLEQCSRNGVPVGDLGADALLREKAGWLAGAGGPASIGVEALCELQPGRFDLSKPYFIGEAALVLQCPEPDKPIFFWEPVEDGLRRTPLYEAHKRLDAKMAPFAGWEMPLWYSSVAEEHGAVRRAAGLFDVAHMGVLEVAGEDATRLIDAVYSNYAGWLRVGSSSYGYLLDVDGRCIDDIMVYRPSLDRYLIVVNAANAEKDLAWLLAVCAGRVAIDRDNPGILIRCSVTIRDLKAPTSGADQRVNIALQGPRARRILGRLVDDPGSRRTLFRLGRTGVAEIEAAGVSVIAARTGYTGERLAFELLVQPDDAVHLWDRILEVGAPLGAKPCGLAARDSLRIEAGLPLYGHELAGPHDIAPVEAGFGPYVKFFKPFFVGRDKSLARHTGHEMVIVRFKLERPGTRAVHHEDPVVSRQGNHIGWVTSCALVGGVQMGLALIQKRYANFGAQIGVFSLPAAGRMPAQRSLLELTPGDKLLLHEWATVLTRFPTGSERADWSSE